MTLIYSQLIMKFKPLFFSTFFKYPHRFYIIPTVNLYYNPNEFLDNGEYSTAFGLTFTWLFWGWEILIQDGI